MAKEKRARNSGADQIRAHQEECWRRAALEAARAVLYLLEAQDGLHGPDWRDQMVRAKRRTRNSWRASFIRSFWLEIPSTGVREGMAGAHLNRRILKDEDLLPLNEIVTARLPLGH